MEHLFNSAVRVERLQLTEGPDGRAHMGWSQATDEDPALNDMLQFLKCRLDMNFIRQGKDALPAEVAGRAADRIGVLFCSAYAPIKAGDRLVVIPNERNQMPVKGTFDIRSIPDEAIGFSDQHHIEVQIIETGQELKQDEFPFEEPDVQGYDPNLPDDDGGTV